MKKRHPADLRREVDELNAAVKAGAEAVQLWVENYTAVTAENDRLRSALEPFATVFNQHGLRYAKVGSDWFDKMPAEWPIALTVTMQNGRDATAALKPA